MRHTLGLQAFSTAGYSEFGGGRFLEVVYGDRCYFLLTPIQKKNRMNMFLTGYLQTATVIFPVLLKCYKVFMFWNLISSMTKNPTAFNCIIL